MKWDTVILSEPEYDHLVAELHFGDQFLLLLDREDGREGICIAFPKKEGGLGERIALDVFIEQLRMAAENLRR
ncbi:hypothetical protein ALP02_200120 [Pseudomonas coronafaciens pv. garcae]|nr:MULTISPECIES: hypothetical protein [Pseudomonas syringae group]RMV73277.1 hypothetical protein ALP06_03427 [Pseudomonas coronafaciens pv. atropurpurea]RMV89216.1 hypothetical protein ALP02_200120 [Pseudomonas coronafaciens pv. garcae]